jgi:two-component system sensor histidine kinase TctE
VRRLGEAIERRAADDLSPVEAPDAPRELRPLIDATTRVMGRLQGLIDHQNRFVRDSAHQLRTPLAVLKVQVQSARRGDLPAEQALADIDRTVTRATTLANQMLSLAKVEQLRQQPDSQPLDFGDIVRQVVLDVSPLIAERALDFGFDAQVAPVTVRAHRWMLEELARNLLHNAIRHSPAGGALTVEVRREGTATALLRLRDAGPGIAPDLRARLFTPFATGGMPGGSGLGLTICREIVRALDGQIALDNHHAGGRVAGLDVTVRLPRQSD